MMRAKKIARLCSIRGCISTETYALTRTMEYGGVIICEQCLRDAISAIESGGVHDAPKPIKELPLFFDPTSQDSGEGQGKNPEAFACQECGKEFKSKIALTGHMASHRKDGAANG